MTAPRVSVVLPTHNRAHLLPRAIGSVLAQSYADFELIVVDDGSTDDTPRAVAAFGDARIRYVHQPQGGPGAARNAGIAASRGELLAFQDSDDEWLPGKLEKQVACLEAAGGSIGLVVCGHRGHAGRRPYEVVVDPLLAAGDACGSLLTGLHYIPPTWLARRTALDRAGPFDPALPSCEDHDLAFRLSDVCGFAAVPEVLVVKHDSPVSVFNDPARKLAGLQALLERHRRRWRASPRWLSHYEFMVGRLLIQKEHYAGGLRYLALSVLHDPWRRPLKLLHWSTSALWRRRGARPLRAAP